MTEPLWKTLGLLAAGMLLAGATAQAGEKSMMHCFAFTVVETATDEDWQAFRAATDAMPKKIKSIKRVWHGKLLRPLNQFNAKGERNQRQHGVCMEFRTLGEETLKAYAADPYHAEWMKAYEKVRKPGTTTYDILGE